jgi:hypothetical protein
MVVDHVPTTAFAAEGYTSFPGTTISVPVPNHLDSASGRGLEALPKVSDHAVLTIVVVNYWSFRTCLWLPIVHYCPRCPMP